MKKIAVIQFPGSNCERESILALKRNGLEPAPFLWNQDYNRLSICQGYFIVGGFSYEDRSRAGVIAALDPVINVLRRESEKGKPVLGICNGAQILVETGLVPGCQNYPLAMALDANRRMLDGEIVGSGFYNGWVTVQMTTTPDRCVFTRDFKPGETMRIPVAHAEGRFVIPPDLMTPLRLNNQLAFKYVSDNGDPDPNFPVNPNGSVENLAAVCNPAGNVMAMMPHPERTANGDKIFISLQHYLLSGEPIKPGFPDYQPPVFNFDDYCPEKGTNQLLVDLVITDNEAVSVEQALQRLGHPVKVRRQTHWELKYDSEPTVFEQHALVESGELFNSNKERLADPVKAPNTYQILTRHREGAVGKQKLKALREWFGIKSLTQVRRGVLWTLQIEGGQAGNTLHEILDTHLLFNPYAHECYWYGREIE